MKTKYIVLLLVLVLLVGSGLYASKKVIQLKKAGSKGSGKEEEVKEEEVKESVKNIFPLTINLVEKDGTSVGTFTIYSIRDNQVFFGIDTSYTPLKGIHNNSINFNTGKTMYGVVFKVNRYGNEIELSFGESPLKDKRVVIQLKDDKASVLEYPMNLNRRGV